MTFVIVGGGPTGVELAGAIAELARHRLEREFRAIDPANATSSSCKPRPVYCRLLLGGGVSCISNS